MAGKQIALPSGGSVTLRDPKTLKHGDRRRIFAVLNGVADGQAGVMEGTALIDALITVMVESWTLDLLPPSVRAESLDELGIEDYDALQAEAEQVLPLLFPKLAKTVEAELDPKATTANSSV